MVSGWETYGQCFPIKYLYYKTNYATYTVPSKFIAAYRRITGIVCTTDLSGNIIAAQLNLLTGHLPYRWGTVTRGYNAVSLPAGGLLYLVPNLVNIGTPIAVSGITFPVAGPSMANAVASWMFPLPVPLDFSVQIVISANPTTTSLPYSFTGTCAVSYLGRLSPISCSFTSSSSSISYFLTISQPGLLLTNSSFSIIHYGLSTGNTFSSVTTTISCYSLLNSQTPGSNDLIYVAASEAIPVSSPGYMGPSSLSLGSYSSWTGSRAVTTYFNFSFSLVSKGLYPT